MLQLCRGAGQAGAAVPGGGPEGLPRQLQAAPRLPTGLHREGESGGQAPGRRQARRLHQGCAPPACAAHWRGGRAHGSPRLLRRPRARPRRPAAGRGHTRWALARPTRLLPSVWGQRLCGPPHAHPPPVPRAANIIFASRGRGTDPRLKALPPQDLVFSSGAIDYLQPGNVKGVRPCAPHSRCLGEQDPQAAGAGLPGWVWPRLLVPCSVRPRHHSPRGSGDPGC